MKPLIFFQGFTVISTWINHTYEKRPLFQVPLSGTLKN